MTQQSKQVVEQKKFGVLEDGRSATNRFHLFADCSTIRGNSAEELSDREVALLGLKVCTVCEKRQQGGPALDILEGFFGEDWPFDDDTPTGVASHPREAAWKLKEYLAEHNVSLVVRKSNGEAK